MGEQDIKKDQPPADADAIALSKDAPVPVPVETARHPHGQSWKRSSFPTPSV